jgi:hypothetical protein
LTLTGSRFDGTEKSQAVAISCLKGVLPAAPSIFTLLLPPVLIRALGASHEKATGFVMIFRICDDLCDDQGWHRSFFCAILN